MSTNEINEDDRKRNRFDLHRHAPDYRHQFESTTQQMQQRCPIAWSDTYDGHWVAAGAREVFELARSADALSNDHDVKNERRGYAGISIPDAEGRRQIGFLEMDPPEQRHYRQALNPYLSPAAVSRWIPVIDEVVRACIDEKIESGRIDFVHDLANIVPGVLTLAMMGIPIKNWPNYSEAMHAVTSTPPDSPDWPRVRQLGIEMTSELSTWLTVIRDNPRPGIVNTLLHADINGSVRDDEELLGVVALIIGGGFDTTTGLTGHALGWLSEHPVERDRLSSERATLLDSATEEFLRYFTPAAGDGRTFSTDCEIAGQEFKEGERLWLSWAMANRDPAVFPDPNTIDLGREANRHHSFGLGIHRCIGSNVARTVFKRMLTAVLDRLPDYVCDPEGAVHYETIGVIQGIHKLPATFTPGTRIGNGLDETLDTLQRLIDEQRLAEPITTRRSTARLS